MSPVDEATIPTLGTVGGLGGAVAETVAASYPVPIEMVGFTGHNHLRSASYYQLRELCGLMADRIVEAARSAVTRKPGSREGRARNWETDD
jgi:transketolase C-terminal domain/subunit